MNKWECIQVNHHKDIGETIEEYQRKGWALHTYQAAGVEGIVKHYLYLEKKYWLLLQISFTSGIIIAPLVILLSALRLKRVRNAARTLIPCSINNRVDKENSRTQIANEEA